MAEKTKGTTKSGGQKHALDKFYTKPEIAAWCLEQLNLDSYDQIIEPSAGSGSFSLLIPGVTAFDLEPEHPSIQEQDWFLYKQERQDNKRVLVVGNPPFGQQNSLAVRFINHATQFADTIAFIVPSSFQKESIQDRISHQFHLAQSTPLPRNSFTLDGEDVDVPCVFQVWEHAPATLRQVRSLPRLVGFTFVKKADSPDIFLQRVGGRAGVFGTDWAERSEQSNYFLKVADTFTAEDVLTGLGELRFPAKEHSVGPRSISKKEILFELAGNASPLVQP